MIVFAGVTLPWLLFVLHALCFRSWIIDDAGISFVYARNLAAGHGLVSQPGMPPVEGYSNPLWVLMLVPFFALGVFHPVLTSKLLSVFLIAGAFALLSHSLRRIEAGVWPASAALTLIALNTPFAVWTTSGLENPLYVFLLCLLFDRLLADADAVRRIGRGPAILGLVAGGIALTRPEGVLYAGLYPAVQLLRHAGAGRRTWRQELRGLAIYATSFTVVAGAYLTFRGFYFGDLMPNTYYVKGGPDASDALLRVPELLAGLGFPGIGLTVVLAGMAYWLARGPRFTPDHTVLGLFTLWPAVAYLLLPADWMDQYRFATPFFVFFYAAATMIVAGCVRQDLVNQRFFKTALVIAAVVVQVVVFVPRSARFSRHPTVDFASIAQRFAARFDEYAERLGVEDGSVLLPDVGATLYYSRLRVHDLAGLTDATIARTLRQRPPAFRRYVFEQLRPTFIHVHGTWTARARFDSDTRFKHDYVAIVEYFEDEWSAGEPMRSGDFVRRDAVSNETELRALQRENAR